MSVSSIVEDRAVDEDGASAIVGLAPATLASMRSKGGGPRFVRVGKRLVRYRVSDLLAWLAARVVTSTSDMSEAEREAEAALDEKAKAERKAERAAKRDAAKRVSAAMRRGKAEAHAQRDAQAKAGASSERPRRGTKGRSS